MEGRKGVALALEALARVKTKGVNFQYRVGNIGPEVGHLRRLALRLGLASEILFAPPLSGEAYQKELGATHIYLLPSFRESSGLTMMEAMLAGCVPVVADCGGPGFVVTDECGFKVPVSGHRRMAKEPTRCCGLLPMPSILTSGLEVADCTSRRPRRKACLT